MNSISRSILWRMWHEHVWYCLGATLLPLGIGITVYLLVDQDAFEHALVMTLLPFLPIAILMGVDAAVGERTRGTLAFTQALPDALWKVAMAKLLAGLACCVVPVFVTIPAITGFVVLMKKLGLRHYLQSEVPFPIDEGAAGFGMWIFQYSGFVALLVVSLYLSSAVLSVYRRHELTASGFVVFMIIMAWSALMLMASIADRVLPDPKQYWSLAAIVVAAFPGGLAFLVSDATVVGSMSKPFLCVLASTAAATHVAIAVLFVRLFGQSLAQSDTSTSRRHSSRLSRQPFASPISAIVWKQFRESGGVVALGVAVIMAVLTVPVAMMFITAISLGTWFALERALESLIGSFVVFWPIVMLIGGVNLFLGDLSPGLDTFWRSRPIRPGAWFWGKFLCGLVLMMTPLAAVRMPSALGYVTPHPFFYLSASISLSVFSAAVLWTCLSRNAVFSAMLSIVTVYLSARVVHMLMRVTQGLGTGFDVMPIQDLVERELVIALLVTSVVLAFAARWAFQLHWRGA